MELKLADSGTAFATRFRARRMLAALDYEPEVIDFEGVRSISHSFADEFLGKILQRAADRGRSVALINLEGKASETVEEMLRYRGLDDVQTRLAA